MIRSIVCRVLFVLFAPVLIAGCGGGDGRPLVELGAVVPEFALEDLDGKLVDSTALAGKPLVINFWATWCQSCKKEIPELKGLSESGVAVVGIALDEGGADRVRPFVEKYGIDYTVLLGDPMVFERFAGLTIPYTLALDAEQRVVGIYRGTMHREAVERDLQIEQLSAKGGEDRIGA